jgi:uncharacterized protein YyaL (SSP411 family)
VVTSWNGLALGALAEAGQLLGESRYLAGALAAADLLLDLHLVDGRLRRTSRNGLVGEAGAVAEDYANLAQGLLTLHQVTRAPRWLASAGSLLDVLLEHFAEETGGLYDTADDAEQLISRPREVADNATPSGQSAAAAALLTYSSLTSSLTHRAAAERILATVGGLAKVQPRFTGWVLATAEAMLAGPVEVAVVGERGFGPLTQLAWTARPPGAVVVSGDPDDTSVPLLAGRVLVAGAAAAYVCRGMVCDRPVTGTDELAQALRSAPGR